MNIKNSIKKIGKYIGLGVVGGLTMFNISNAQDNPKNNYKQVTEIRQEGDNIIIPENKLNEFLKNYTPKKKINNLEKITDAVKDGYVIDALDNTPLEGIEASLWVIDYGTLIDTIGPVNTNFQGYYSFSITGIENIVKTENIGEIKYQIINTPQIQLNLNKLSKVEIKIYDLLGKEIKTLLDEETSQKTINTNINNLASGVYFLKTIIDGKLYANKILKTENKYNYGKTTDKITQKNSTNKNLEKLATELGVVRVFEDPNNQYHKYQHTLVEPYAENKTENFALIPRMNLFNIHDPNYSVIDTIKTIRDAYWYFYSIEGDWDLRAAAPSMYNMRLFIDTTNCPPEWKNPIRDAIQYYRDSIATYLGLEPDSLIIETDHFTEPTGDSGFSTVNMYYVQTLPDNRDSRRTYYFSNSYITFIGVDIELNLSTGMLPIDVFKEINRSIEEYIVKIDAKNRSPPGMLIDRWGRGEPRTLTEKDKILTKTSYNIQKTNKFTNYSTIYP